MGATPFLWSTQLWDGLMDSLLTMCNYIDYKCDPFKHVFCNKLKGFQACFSLVTCDRMDKLYWVDSLLDQIGSIGIVGIGRQTFTNIGQITQPYSLTVYSGNLLDFPKLEDFTKCVVLFILQP